MVAVARVPLPSAGFVEWAEWIPLALAVVACSAPSTTANAPSPCPGEVRQPLVNGSAGESYLGLSFSQIDAIVAVVDPTRPEGPLCSGVFVGPGWVATARHCLAIQPAAVLVQGVLGDPIATLPVVATVAHPSADIALLNVTIPDSAAGGGTADADQALVSFFPAGTTAAPLAAGEAVEMAGYGLTEAGGVRRLRFLVETIVAVSAESVTVSGFGASGACDGDSGGPMLVRRPDGTPVVLGLLSAGSPTCLEDDTYTRLDAIQDWIASYVASSLAPRRECGTLDEAGRCFYGAAAWCEGGTLSAEACDGARQCGWDEVRGAFRCVSAALDPCGGVDAVGACRGGVAVRCAAGGKLESTTCLPCDNCRIQGTTGLPQCVARSD